MVQTKEGGITRNPGGEKLLTFNFTALFGATFLMFFAVDFFIPVLPFYVVEAGGRETLVGLLMGLFVFCSVVLRPFQGRRLNRTGRRRLLILGVSIYALGCLGLLSLPPLGLLFLFRAMQGFGWGAFLLAFNTMTIDLAPAGRKGEAVGLMGAAPPLSLATAPLLGEYVRNAAAGYIPVFAVPAATALAALLLAAALKEPALDRGGDDKLPLFSRKVLLPSVMIFFITFTFGGIITFIPLLGESRNIAAVGAFFTVLAVATIITRPMAGRLSDRWGRPKVFLPGLIVLGISLAVIAFTATPGWLLAGGLLFGCGMGAAHATIMALAADRLAAVERGVGMATFTAAFDLGIVAGASILGLLLARLGFDRIFLICALVALLPVAVYLLRPSVKTAG